ncbi:hypothetical protein BCR44DRAFT_1425400 [Catenaria anguillulae PL171]|uniref:Uncharacterized protein n=1 Tax=Catenaria anguillulae PL171 TaxID=765915 RepID=A0A1Y2I177_9FUNG|nr:hypothetical protein BCR44DRAFT_1425400 [Catenaria anguillulae PL171]
MSSCCHPTCTSIRCSMSPFSNLCMSPKFQVGSSRHRRQSTLRVILSTRSRRCWIPVAMVVRSSTLSVGVAIPKVKTRGSPRSTSRTAKTLSNASMPSTQPSPSPKIFPGPLAATAHKG